ncbi:MAG: GGDEF domain-containing protein [Candidatus Gastranaerophilales bacterium]|nr:GGDEF domain-containing protein [Candidatus Gastranaerophilales bacterium]
MNCFENHTELDFIWEVSRSLTCNLAVEDIFANLYSIFEQYLCLNDFNIILRDESQNSFKFYDRQWEIMSDKRISQYEAVYSTLTSTIRLNFLLNGMSIVINDDFDISYKIELKKGKNTLYIPMMQNYKCIGFLEIIIENIIQRMLIKSQVKTFFVLSSLISSTVINQELNAKILKSADFYKAQKNIAKILETQYDYSFLIPVIGEILDNFASEYFVYIFMRDDGDNFELAWPLRYDKKRLNPVLENIDLKQKITVSGDKKIVLFPIFFENALKGAIIIDGKQQCIAQEDIDYLLQLSQQTATTLDKAGVYAEIEKYATQDALTALNNRRSLDLRIVQEIAIAHRKNLPLCVMMLDVDYFKKINDTYGHYVGDVVLKEFSKIIKDEVREYDFAARYGGEEFFMILPSTTIEEAEIVANRLKGRIENMDFDISKFNAKQSSLKITTSIGLVKLHPKEDMKALYQRVDNALYQAKKGGRNKVVVL